MRQRSLVITLIAFVLSCAPEQISTELSDPTPLCSNRVGAWADCKSRCIPREQLYAQCSTKLGVVFSTRAGLLNEQQYGWTQEPETACGGVITARIWKLKRINVTKAEVGYLSPPETTTPDCSKAYTRELDIPSDRLYYTSTDVTASQAAYLDSMSTAITPASPTQIVQTFNAPADGDIANAASVNVAFQSLENSAEALRYLTYGGGFYPRVKATSNTVMTIQPLGAVVVLVAGVWTVVPHTVATTIDPLALAGGAFAANTRYYVYVNVVAGVITWSVSTTAADAGWRYKTGDEQYQFVSTFYTDAVPNLLTYSQTGKQYTYSTKTATGGGVRGNLLLDTGNAIVATNITITSTAIPASANSYVLTLQGTTSAGAGTAYVGLALPGQISSILYPQAPVTGPDMKDLVGNATPLQYLNNAATTFLDVWATQFTL